ncbi:MAG: VanW family protein [Clostridium sp.]|nr:VanW family protein [Clostridium sp.]
MKKKGLKLTVLLLMMSIIFAGACHVAYAKNDNQTMYGGVYLDGVYVGGLTKEEAMEEYNHYVEGIEDLKITFRTSVGSYSTTLKEIGISVSVEDAVEQAYNYGRQGNILSRYKEIKQLEEENVVLVPTKEFDQEKLKEILENETGDIVTEPQNASITRENGEFIVHESITGTTVDTDETIKEVEKLFAEEWQQRDMEVAVVVKEQEPQYTTADFEAIEDVLGQGSTDYTGSSARRQNLATGASKISGTVLMPGEEFSVYNAVSPFTAENGYENAGQYVSNGSDIELVDGYGGGICQVSTTLYLAVLRAELNVTERYPHSLTVSYVKHGMDAAIAGDYMDFKFENSTEYPIYIDGYAGGGTISFAIYGHDSRPANRTIEFESIDVNVDEPGDPEEIKDDTLEEGKTATEQSAYTGYYTELWKHVYIDGVETEKYLVDFGKSTYQSQRAKIRVGTKKKEKDKKDKDDKDKDNKDKTKDKTTETPTDTTPAEPSSGGNDESEGE